MLDPIIERIQSLGPEVKAAIAAFIVLVGIICVAKPITNCIKAFSDAKWMQGCIWGAAALAVVFGWGKELGEGMEGELSFIMMQIQSY